MSEEKISEDDSWVFDSLVNFLHGAIWKLPVLGFIEEKSVVFDPDSYSNMTDEKEEEYRKIHEEYKALVDYMLANFMEDLHVTPEQVEEGCRIREKNKADQPESNITKMALEQLWAAEDFGAFRRLMTRKNIDLQLQSLELLVARYGVLSPALCPFESTSSAETGDVNGEEDFLQVVISQILQQEENENPTGPIVTTPEAEAKVFPVVVVAEAPEENDDEPSPLPPIQPEISKPPATRLGLDDVTVAEMASVREMAPEQHRILTAVRRAFDVPTEEGEPLIDTLAIPVTGTEEEISRRRDYLRSQRDKLVALKKREREKQLLNYGRGNGEASNSDSSVMRPKSAKAAQLAIRNPNVIAKTTTNEKSLQARRALAQRIKQELVDK